MNGYSEMNRYELAVARSRVGGNQEEWDRIETAFQALDRKARVLGQRSLQPKYRDLTKCR
jgi:hypothetical protein